MESRLQELECECWICKINQVHLFVLLAVHVSPLLDSGRFDQKCETAAATIVENLNGRVYLNYFSNRMVYMTFSL